MKNKLYLPLLLLAAILFTACPYQSQVPIDDPSVKVDKALLGKWIDASEKDKVYPAFYDIRKEGPLEYKIIENTFEAADSSYRQVTYISHISTIDSLSFLNMKDTSSMMGEGYYLYKIKYNKKEMSLQEVTDNIQEQFETSKDLKAFVAKHMHLSFFYNQDAKKYIREGK